MSGGQVEQVGSRAGFEDHFGGGLPGAGETGRAGLKGDALEDLEKARSAGKIKRIGVSNFSVEQMRPIMQAGTIDAHQLAYSLLWRRPEREMIPFCKEHDIAVIGYGVLAEGVLTGKYLHNRLSPVFDKRDVRSRIVYFHPETWSAVYETIVRLKDLASEVGCSLSSLAIRWALAQQGICGVLVGCRNANQVKENIVAMNNALRKFNGN